jgi:putative addiction module killer protein
VYSLDYNLLVLSIRSLPEFTAWIDGLKDETLRGVIVARIKRLERGLMGDVQPVGNGVSELRIHLGPGWHPARYAADRAAGRWLEAHPEKRHRARSGTGGFARLIGGEDHAEANQGG